ncbi:ribosomal L7Ae/L30e/S12e/Gadd45 family protein [Clostridium fallax]|uniref:Ribosomal protein L7Ae n=1 Tax=Clostridium fallax TaxID=1533 RepID=A0A1M4V3A0_9CLOT|nr:ribosomal L7Ae/L30e/S12e/Gadd45 family protein [Clostridium fallax]SHE63367.1 Ribosomal protein L7Ae [Clostridium fallax]SQB06573.1 ribosomal protein L7Ae family protein [Clostridium fallax]
MNNKFYSFLGLVKRSGNLLEGYNRCEENLNKKRIYLFIFSKELSLKSKDKFLKICKDKEIPYIDELSKEELGLSLGRKEINILGVTDKNMAEKLIKNSESV